MKKYTLLTLLFSLLIFSCEKDDFCIEPVTPNFIIRFYDATNSTDVKSVSELYVWPNGKDSIFSNVTLDSIAIPLDVNSNQTIYQLSQGATQDQITINYTVREVFVSRSCGFKAVFDNVTVTTNSNNWIQSVLPLDPVTVENENAAHVQIFH